MKESIKKIGALVALFGMVIGAVGGVGYLMYYGEIVPAVGVLALVAGALPTIGTLWKMINDACEL